jgi:peptidoglycan/LPS O-acetylase OafA/YrhL
VCYSIYIWHGVLRVQLLGPNRAPERVLLYLAAVAAVSYVSFHFIEMNRWFRPVRPTATRPVKAEATRRRTEARRAADRPGLTFLSGTVCFSHNFKSASRS